MTMPIPKKPRFATVLIMAASIFTVARPGEASADVYADDLTRCLVESTTEADRVAFVRWMFMAMSRHPDVADLADVSDAQVAEGNRQTARLIQRLILTNCRSQAAAALRYEGFEAVVAGFEMVGEVAVGGLMNHPAVAAELEELDDYMDQAAWEKFVRESER